MRFAYVCVDPGIPIFGSKGASVHVQEVVRELIKAGHEVEFFVTRVGKQVPEDLAHLPVHEFKPGTKDPAERELAQKRASAEISEAILAAGFDAIYERYSLFSTVIADAGLPAVLEVNAPLIDEQLTHRDLIDRDYPAQALVHQVEAASASICVSDQVKSWVLGHLPADSTAASKVYTVANGVNVNRISPTPEDESVTVVFVGTLKPWHGTGDLLTAASLAKNTWNLRIVGDGPERQNLEEQARQLGLTVDFRGAVAPEEVPLHLAGTAIGVAPYPAPQKQEDNYFSPLKVYEYMAAGLALVASNIGQVPQIMGQAGKLVEPSSPQQLADAIDHFIEDDAARHIAQQAARKQAVTQHSWESVVRKILSLAQLSEAENHG